MRSGLSDSPSDRVFVGMDVATPALSFFTTDGPVKRLVSNGGSMVPGIYAEQACLAMLNVWRGYSGLPELWGLWRWEDVPPARDDSVPTRKGAADGSD